MDPQTRQAMQEFAQEVRSLHSKVDTLGRAARTPQLANSSLEEGQTIEARDETGALRGRWGWVDGAVGLVTEGGDPVSAPTAPQVTPSLGGLRVTWDGLLSGDPAIPVDFDHMAVHVSTTSGFSPSAATYVGTIRRAGAGGMLPVVPLPYVPHYVILIPVTTGGVQGDPSAEVAATPLQTSGIDLQADSVEAVHIQAGAVEADKLEAVLALVTTIIAGIPGAARVEMDQDGLRGYSTDNELIFAIDSSGNAVFSGDIVASEISGSRFTMGTAPGPIGVIEADSTTVGQRVQSGSRRAQLGATTTQANFLAATDATDPTAPMAGFAALDSSVQFVLDSSAAPDSGLPSITGLATASSSQLIAWASRSSTSAPYCLTAVYPGQATTVWSSPGGQVRVLADEDGSYIRMSGSDAAADPVKWARINAIAGTDSSRALSIRSPEADGDALRSTLILEGSGPSRASTRTYYYSDEHRVRAGLNGSSVRTAPAQMRFDTNVSLNAPIHQPVRTDMVTAPSGTFSGGWNAFSNTAYPAITFTTGASGKARITITAAAGNTTTSTSTVHFGFALSDASSVPAAVGRAWSARGVLMQCCSRVIHLDLVANASYTLTPSWNISSGTAGAGVNFYTTYEHSIVVEPLM